MKYLKELNEGLEFLDGMIELNRDQQKELANELRGLIWAYEHREDDMSHIPGHPGSEAYLNARMNQAKDLMQKFKIEKAK